MSRSARKSGAGVVLLLCVAALACNVVNLIDDFPGGPEDEFPEDLTAAVNANATGTTAGDLRLTQQAENLRLTDVAAFAVETTVALTQGAGGGQLLDATPTPLPDDGLRLTNPGFEDGILGWVDINTECGSRSDADDSQAHSGTQARKLYLRYCGSFITQRVSGSAPAGSTLTLSAWVKMPQPGSTDNKSFTLSLVANGAGDATASVFAEQYDALADWTQLTLPPLTPEFAVTSITVILETDHGQGNYREFDRPVWVDDLALTVVRP